MILNIPSIAYILPGLMKNTEKISLSRNITIERVVSVVCDYFNITIDDLRKVDRHTEYVYPRHIAFYLISQYCKITQRHVGSYFNMHRTSYWHGYKYVESQLSLNMENQYKEDVNKLKHLI